MSEHREETLVKELYPDWGKPWYKVPHLVKLVLLCLVVEINSAATGYDGNLTNGLQILPQWQKYFYSPNGYKLGALILSPIFGQIAGAPIAIYLSDQVGRKFAIVSSTLFVVGMCIFQACSKNYGMLYAARFLMGFFGAAGGLSAPALVSEIAYPAHRGPITALYNTFYNLGALISAIVTYGCYFWPHQSTWAWRLPTLMQGFLPLVALCLLYWVPESPRFLVKKGKIAEARAILLKHHAGNNEELGGPLVEFELAEIHAAIERQKDQSVSVKAFFTTKPNFKRLMIIFTLAFCMQMSGNSLLSFYLSYVLKSIGVTSTTEQLRYSIGLTLFGWGCSVLQSLVVGRLPRRKVLLSCISFMLVTFIIWTAVSWVNTNQMFANPSMGKAVLAMIFLTSFAYSFALNGLPYLYLTEIMPFNLRSTGLFLLGFFGACWTVMNGFVNAIAMEKIGSKYYTVFCCCICLELVLVYFFCPETHGYSLEETAKVFGDYAEPELEKTHASEKLSVITHSESLS